MKRWMMVLTWVLAVGCSGPAPKAQPETQEKPPVVEAQAEETPEPGSEPEEPVASTGPTYDVSSPSLDAFLSYAMITGLAEDAMPVEMAEAIAEERSGQLFVGGKCPICSPVQDAFRAHVASGVTGESRLPEAIAAGFQSEDIQVQRAALRDVTKRYVHRAYERLGMDTRAQAEMAAMIEAGRKQGMGAMGGAMDYCPSCDGAANIL